MGRRVGQIVEFVQGFSFVRPTAPSPEPRVPARAMAGR